MLFLEIPSLQALTQELSGIVCDHSQTVLYGRIYCFGTRGAGSDKKLYKEIEQQLQAEIAKSPGSPELHSSPMGALTEKHSRDTLKYLIATLNASFQDYDFRNIDPSEAFRREFDFSAVMGCIDGFLRGIMGQSYDARSDSFSDAPLRERVLAAILAEIQPADCEMYSYLPDSDALTEEATGSVDSVTVFFFNKKLRRVLFFTARAMSSTAVENFQLPSSYEDGAAMGEGQGEYFTPAESFEHSQQQQQQQQQQAPVWLGVTQPQVRAMHATGRADGPRLVQVQPTFSASSGGMADTVFVDDEVPPEEIFGLDDDFTDLPPVDPVTFSQMTYSTG